MRTKLKRPTPEKKIGVDSIEVEKLNIRSAKVIYYTNRSKRDDDVWAAFVKFGSGVMTKSWGAPLSPNCTII